MTLDLNKPYHELTDAELPEAMAAWGKMVDEATGFTSAHFAAQQCRAIEAHGRKRGLTIPNNWPISHS